MPKRGFGSVVTTHLALGRFHGLHPDFEGLGSSLSHLEGQLSNDAAGFASCYGPHSRSPSYRAYDAGLRPRPFPDETVGLLPGLLAATRTGLPPVSDDELTNNKISRYVTASPPALLGARKRLTGDYRRAQQTNRTPRSDYARIAFPVRERESVRSLRSERREDQ